MKPFQFTRVCIAIGIGSAVLAGGGAFAAPDGQGEQDLRARVAALESRLAELEEQRGEAWFTEERASEIRAIVQDVLTDADTRASLLQGGATAGWDNGFFLASADGNFRLNVEGQLQFRYVLNLQDDSAAVDGDTTRQGFENRRTKLIFTGYVIDPTWIYRLQANFDDSGSGTFGLQDAYMGKVLGGGWVVVAGQFKVPMLRETLVDTTMQLAVERSLLEAEFGAGRTQGVALWYRDDRLDFWAGYTDGHPATGGFNAPALAPDTDFSLTARASVLLAGTSWDQFNDLTSFKNDDFGFMLGGAIHYQDGEFGTAGAEVEVVQWTIDASVEFGGANVFTYVVGRHIDFNGGPQLDQFGVLVQGGVFLTDAWEVFARYEWGDDDLTSDDLSIITVGATNYLSGHRVKWTTDVGFALDSISNTWGDGFLGVGGEGTGYRTDVGREEDQVVLRSQLQLLF